MDGFGASGAVAPRVWPVGLNSGGERHKSLEIRDSVSGAGPRWDRSKQMARTTLTIAGAVACLAIGQHELSSVDHHAPVRVIETEIFRDPFYSKVHQLRLWDDGLCCLLKR